MKTVVICPARVNMRQKRYKIRKVSIQGEMICGGLASYFIFVAAVRLIISGSEVYQREASGWIDWMLFLIMGTGVLTLAMDYSNTKSVLNLFIIGFVSGSLGAVIEARRAQWRKQEKNL